MREQLKEMGKVFNERLEEVQSLKALEDLRITYLGKKGELKALLTQMKDVPKEDRPKVGQWANALRDEMEEAINNKRKAVRLAEIEKKIKQEAIDVTMPGRRPRLGAVHPNTKITRDIINILVKLGFTLREGPEIETVYNNFDALNAPKDHPSRSASDTFYLDAKRVLRTHTSPVQIRTMKSQRPPIRMISVGRCFRNDEFDATHSPMFYQMEGLVVSEDATMVELKGVLETFVFELFGGDIKSVFRPHNFPFTEPSAEIDITCFKCKGSGCKFCSHTGAIEILGCGMVHPNVLKECGIDPEKYKGYAFGMGLDRITMLKYEIDDIRLLYDNDVRFIQQFRR